MKFDREQWAVAVANWILRTFAPTHSKFISGAVEYGMRAAVVDAREGKPFPPDWRQRFSHMQDQCDSLSWGEPIRGEEGNRCR